MAQADKSNPQKSNLFALIKPYWRLIIPLVVLALVTNGLTLWLPRLLSNGIDGFLSGANLNLIFWQFGLVASAIFLLTCSQGVVQSLASERVARDLRNRLSNKISTNSLSDLQEITPAKLLTNLTSDIDSVKSFVSQAVVIFVSSIFLIVGGSFLLISTNWKLGLAVLAVLPIIGVSFFVIFAKVKLLFTKAREIIDWLNKVINENILGAALIRVLDSHDTEHIKFAEANAQSRDVGMGILKLFSAMIPIITFASNLATLIILILGGRFIIDGTMSLGDYAAFSSYLMLLIFPILMLGFVSNIMAQAQASYARIGAVLDRPEAKVDGSLITTLSGQIVVDKINLSLGDQVVLKDVSFTVAPGTKVAIIGPTAAGKTQLLHLLIGLLKPNSGSVKYDGHDIDEYQAENLYGQIGLVFQDSIIFNIGLKENIAFNTAVADKDLELAVKTAELADFIDDLAQGLDTVLLERGTSLSGGQKQRIMLARALAIKPKILLLDDFTARVDADTEQKILKNIAKNYPDLTLISVTQKISAVIDYDQIIVLMEGELIASGRHEDLLSRSPEYVQIYNSQQSTNVL